MSHYTFAQTFRTLYDLSVALQASGRPGPEGYFSPEQLEWIDDNGLTAQNFYDYAEDHNKYGGEPGYDIALGIELVRRDYFLNAQHGLPTGKTIDADRLPPKTDVVLGIEWLPRLIPKAKAKLRGELPSSLMYCCGGDRRFFKAHDIHPAEFLNLVWRYEKNDSAIIDWVYARSTSVSKNT